MPDNQATRTAIVTGASRNIGRAIAVAVLSAALYFGPGAASNASPEARVADF